MIRVNAFTRYDRSAASTRQRLLQYLPMLRAEGMEVSHQALLDDDYVASLANARPYAKRRVAKAYLKRVRRLLADPDCDVIWIYAELFPYLPAWFEKLAFRSGKPVVYDFDDAFFHQYDDHPNAVVRGLLGGKLGTLMSRAYACCCGNDYLLDYALKFCRNSLILPTVVDTDIYRPVPRAGEGPVTIGWIGSPTTWVLVRPYLALLRELHETTGAQIRVVGAGIAADADRFPGLELIAWTEAGEVAEVQKMDIGIMPVWDGPFQRGKSGYKLIQYMACGIPVVASPVGVNGDIVTPDNGFLVGSLEEWRDALTALIEDAGLRRRLGEAGRARVEEKYSLQVHGPRLAEIFRAAAASSAPAAG